MAHAGVEGRVRVAMRAVDAVERFEGAPAVLLRARGLQEMVIGGIGEVHGLAGGELDLRPLYVGVREQRVGVGGRAAERSGGAEQRLARFVEHVLLLAEEVFEQEPVEFEVVLLLDPCPHGVTSEGEDLRAYPRHLGLRAGEQHLDAELRGLGRVVAHVLVVAQRGVPPHPLGESLEIVLGSQEIEQSARSVAGVPPAAGEVVDRRSEFREAVFPRRVIGVDVLEVPAEFGGDLRAARDRSVGVHALPLEGG
jgi:hypothetical protein